MIHGSYAPVRTTFWTDPDVRTSLTPNAKLLLLYFISSPHSNMIGLYSCPLSYVARETGLDPEDVRFHTHVSLKPFLTYDEKTEEVFVHGAARHRLGSDELKDSDRRRGSVVRLFNACHSPYLRSLFAIAHSEWGMPPVSVPDGYKPLVLPIAHSQPEGASENEIPLQRVLTGTEEVEVDGAVAGDGDGTEQERLSGATHPRAVEPGTAVVRAPNPNDPAVWMHEAWQDVLGSGRALTLTPARRQKYRAMFAERLASTEDPRLAWRTVLWAVTQSEHHMGNRDYQLPESLLKSAERREKWVEKALHTAHDNRDQRVADMAEFIRRRRGA